MKKMLNLKVITLIFISLFLWGDTQAQSAESQAGNKVNKWFNSHTWLNGLQLEPHKSINKKEFARQYDANKIWWDKAFEYLRVTDLINIPPGRYAIDGDNVFAIITDGPGKEFEQGKWESHRHYNDIQHVIRGEEKIGIAPFPSLTVTEPYDNSKDIAFYTGKGKYYTANPTMFFIFFPENAHRPGIKIHGADPIKKIVIKVKTGL